MRLVDDAGARSLGRTWVPGNCGHSGQLLTKVARYGNSPPNSSPDLGVDAVRALIALVSIFTLSGCTTTTYTSQKSAESVSSCIARGWRTVPSSGVEVPVSLTKEQGYYFVDVVLVRDFPTFLPIHSIWAKVRSGNSGDEIGSTTEYRRNFQIGHEKIDKVVLDCQ